MRTLIAIVALFCTCLLPAQTHAADAQGPEALAARFVDAWNMHDPAAFEPLFTESAYWVPTVDTRLDGRAAILADLGTAHATWAKRTTMAVAEDSVATRAIGEGVAVVLFHAPFRNRDGALAAPGNAVMLLAVQSPNGWRVAAGQITKPGETVGGR